MNMLLLQWLMFICLMNFVYSQECPVYCVCVQDESLSANVVNCSKTNLREMPSRLDKFVDILDLSDNRIPSTNVPTYENLKKLSLAKNLIQIVEFNTGTNIDEIDLSMNNISDLDHVQVHMISIKILKLSHNNIVHADKFLSSTLQVLDLSYCLINWIKTELLESTPALLELNLEGNPLVNVDPLFSKTLNVLNLSFIYVRFIRGSHLEELSSLKILNISRNTNLVTLDHGGPILNKFVEIVDVSFCSVNIIKLEQLPKLTHLYLQHNQVENITSYTFIYNHNLSFINLSNNHISYISENAFFQLIFLEYLDLSNNLIIDLEWSKNLPVTYLYAHNNKITKMAITRLKNVSTLDLSFNHIVEIQNNLTLVTPKLKYLNLSHNTLTTLSKLYSKTLEVLNLENCDLMLILNDSLNNLDKLRMLDVRNNKLKRLLLTHFINLTELVKINLDNNPWDCECEDNNFKHFYNYLMRLSLTSDSELKCSPQVNFTWSGYCKTIWSEETTGNEKVHHGRLFYSVLTISLVLVMIIIFGVSWKYVRNNTSYFDSAEHHSSSPRSSVNTGQQYSFVQNQSEWPAVTSTGNSSTRRPARLMRSFSNSSSTQPPTYEEATSLPAIGLQQDNNTADSVMVVLFNSSHQQTHA